MTSKTANEGIVRRSIALKMIRHAESRNNEVYRNARYLFKGGTPEFDETGWHGYIDAHRSADPGISQRGQEQSDKLAEYLAPHLVNQASHPVRIITSPMSRTIETLIPTLKKLQSLEADKIQEVKVENGGVEKEEEKEENGDDKKEENGDDEKEEEKEENGNGEKEEEYANAEGKEENGDDEKKEDQCKIIVNGFYFESEGCHVKDKAEPGMNQTQIRDLLSPLSSDITFEGFDQDPSAGWYSRGTKAETRAESETRAAAFYLWLCEYLDSQLESDDHDLFDAGVSLPSEVEEMEHDKLSPRQRRRRTAILVGHGDFMGLVLKRIITGFGHTIENEGVPHRSAFVHFNTGITELEYFGNGRFLLMQSNQTPHLNNPNDFELKTGGGLKDGWSYLIPRDEIVLYEEVSMTFADEIDDHVKEQIHAIGFLNRRNCTSVEESASNVTDSGTAAATKNEITFTVKRGLQVAGFATFEEENGIMTNLAVRASALNVRESLVEAVESHAKKVGKERLIVTPKDADDEQFFQELGFKPISIRSEGSGDLNRVAYQKMLIIEKARTPKPKTKKSSNNSKTKTIKASTPLPKFKATPKKAPPIKCAVTPTLKVAGAYLPGRASSQDLQDYVNIFRKYAEKTTPSNSLRRRAFSACDGNGSGKCSLAEIDGFVQSTLQKGTLNYAGADGNPDPSRGDVLYDLFRPSIIRAFNVAKTVHKGDDDDFVTFSEFRVLNALLCVYAGMLDTFSKIDGGGIGRKGEGVDENDDRRIELTEWLHGFRDTKGCGFVGLDMIETEDQAKEAFEAMDADKKGLVLLIEWCEYIKNAEVEKKTALGKLLVGNLKIVPSSNGNTSQRPTAPSKTRLNSKITKYEPIVISGVYTLGKSSSTDLRDFITVFKPYAEKTAVGSKLRRNMFSSADPNGNGYCSLAEIEVYIKSTLLVSRKIKETKNKFRADELFKVFRPSYIRAFNEAKALAKGDSIDDDYVTFAEFRVLNAYLCIYASMFDAFARVDGMGEGRTEDDDHRIELSEYLNSYMEVQDYGFLGLKMVKNEDQAKAAFEIMDDDRKGVVLLAEWCKYIKDVEIKEKTPLGKLLSGNLQLLRLPTPTKRSPTPTKMSATSSRSSTPSKRR